MPVLSPSTLPVSLVLKQGAEVTITLLGVDDANGQPINPTTGYSVRAQIRATPTGAVLFEWNTTAGTGIGVATITYSTVTLSTTVALVATAAETALWTFATGQWDCFLTDPSGRVACLAEGTVTIDPQITH